MIGEKCRVIMLVVFGHRYYVYLVFLDMGLVFKNWMCLIDALKKQQLLSNISSSCITGT